jgi:hypothetical protein
MHPVRTLGGKMHKESQELETGLETPSAQDRCFEGSDSQIRTLPAGEWKGYSPEILDCMLDP